jgi:AraC family transcriptional regulator
MQSNHKSVVQTPSESLTLFPHSPLLTSLSNPWQNVGVMHLRQPAFTIPEVRFPFHVLAIFPNAASGDVTIDSNSKQQSISPGDVAIIPANAEQSSSWTNDVEILIVGLNPSLFADAINDATHPYSAELVPRFAAPDPLVYQLGLSLKTVIEQNRTGSRLYVETAAAMLSVHLLQHYSQRRSEFKDYADGLSQFALHQVIEYIQAHLDQELGLAELAAIAHLSPHYFTRLFKQSTGMTPHQFVIQCRVKRAKALLLAGKDSIAEIAQQVGFANQAHLSVHIKRALGVTPKMILEQRKNR